MHGGKKESVDLLTVEILKNMKFVIVFCSKSMEFDLKWVHMARYELILKQDGAIWLRIIF